MNNNLRYYIKHIPYDIKRIEYYKNSIIFTSSNNEKYVLKENKNNILDIYNYLNSRGYNYIPELAYVNNDIYIYKYEDDIKTPSDQKISDLVKLLGLLHNKTVYYKDVSLDEIKEIYENLQNKIMDTYNFYDDLITMIESNVYMSPSYYMLARNSSSIFNALSFSKNELENWYNAAKKSTKKRIVLLHNNPSSNHIIKNNKSIIIGWNNAISNMPIYDFIELYKKYYNEYDFNFLYKSYLKIFPLDKLERKLMFIILFIPYKINLNNSEILKTKEVSMLCNYLVTTDKLFMENEIKNTKEQNDKIDK